MKKSFFIITAAAIIFSACSGNSKSESNASEQEVAEAPEVQEFTTPDLTLLEVKGHVKSVQKEGYDDKTTFNAEGLIEATGNYARLKRDSDGRISSWGYDEYFVTWENNLPKTFKTRESDGSVSIDTYTYDESGLLVKSETNAEYPGDESWHGVYTYTYSPEDFDAHGNWLKRQAKSVDGKNYTEARVIEYYE